MTWLLSFVTFVFRWVYSVGNVMDQVVEINGVKLLAVALKDTGMNELRNLGDQFKEKLGNGVVVIASAADGKV